MHTNKPRRTEQQGVRSMRPILPYFQQTTRLFSQRLDAFLARRPHRSFKRTRSRDYKRSLDLPGYWSFTAMVIARLRANSLLFLKVIAAYTLLILVLVGVSSQDTYTQLSELLDNTGNQLFSDAWGSVGQAGLLLLTGLSGGLNPQLTEAQQIYSVIVLLLTWLTTVWLLRSIVAGKRPTFRDGLYNAGGPIVSTGLLLLVLLVQFLPGALAILVASAASSTSLYDTGFLSMIATLITVLFILLSAYWSVATMFALIIVTLPGMYPWQALKAAGDMVVGRRLRLLLRTSWMAALGLFTWMLVVLVVILLTRFMASFISWIELIPVVPVVMTAMTASVAVWMSAYMYILYRKVVEDDAEPA
jgi:hypothetical protein